MIFWRGKPVRLVHHHPPLLRCGLAGTKLLDVFETLLGPGGGSMSPPGGPVFDFVTSTLYKHSLRPPTYPLFLPTIKISLSCYARILLLTGARNDTNTRGLMIPFAFCRVFYSSRDIITARAHTGSGYTVLPRCSFSPWRGGPLETLCNSPWLPFFSASIFAFQDTHHWHFGVPPTPLDTFLLAFRDRATHAGFIYTRSGETLLWRHNYTGEKTPHLFLRLRTYEKHLGNKKIHRAATLDGVLSDLFGWGFDWAGL